MSIKKQYLKSKPICKITFKFKSTGNIPVKTIHLVGEFNDWNRKKTPMTPLRDGSFKTVLNLAAGREYQFRYLVNSTLWQNDDEADNYALNPYGDDDNCIIIT